MEAAGSPREGGAGQVRGFAADSPENWVWRAQKTKVHIQVRSLRLCPRCSSGFFGDPHLRLIPHPKDETHLVLCF